MSLTQQKNDSWAFQIVINALAVITLLVQVLNPQTALADVSLTGDIASIPTTLEESKEGAMFSPVEPVPEPDIVVNGIITAYTSTPDQTDDSPFIAATGKHVHDRMIAANGLPFGTIIKIPELYGDKEFVVEDRMNKRYYCYTTGNKRCRMDVWLDTSKKEAKKFGVKKLKVEIYLPEKQIAKK